MGKYTVIFLAVFLGGTLLYNFGPHSRRTLNPKGKNLEYRLPPDFQKMISVSSGGSEGDVMITYETIEGNIVTKEYNRGNLFETTIHWNPPQKR
jgi:hypothetical protein